MHRSQTGGELRRNFQRQLYLKRAGALDEVLERFPCDKLHRISVRRVLRCRLECILRNPQTKTRRTQPRQQDPCEACIPDRIPSLQKARCRSSGRCVGASCSWTYPCFNRNLSRKQHHTPPSRAKAVGTAPDILFSRSTSNYVLF